MAVKISILGVNNTMKIQYIFFNIIIKTNGVRQTGMLDSGKHALI